MSGKISFKIQQILLISAAVIIGAQVNMNLFNSEFKISVGILAFSMVLVLFGAYPVFPVTLLSAAGVFASRVLIHWLNLGVIDIGRFLPEMVFYLVYGILFGLYCRRKDYVLTIRSTVILFAFDYISNLTELLLRSSVEHFTWNAQLGILLVAASRTLVILFIMLSLRHYKFDLLKREHAQRYQRLLLLISRMNGEVVLMQKNSKMIEDTMNTAYRLYQEMEQAKVDPSLSQKALTVAKDVHELKKEYALILRGLSEVLDLNLNDEGMMLSDIMQVLKNSLQSSLPEGKTLDLDIQLQENLYTEKHYFLMSVLRNLLNNALEASRKPEVHIRVTQSEANEMYLFQVEDDGPGILPEDMGQIFSPGFSTKINYETGEINRGLGLNLVKDLIENQWNGTISATSRPGKTTFTIQIPKEDWKGRVA